MTKTIALCDGHGMGTSGKRTPFIPELGRFIHENEFNRAVVNFLDIELRRCGFNTLLVAPTDFDTSLEARTTLANSRKVDAYVSVHYDAIDGKFDEQGKDPEGHTVYVYKNQKSKESGKLAECVLKYLNQVTAQQNRGIKEADFQVLRETNMIAILSENGFMDNKREAMLMADPNFQKEVAVEHAKGICEYFGMAYSGTNVNAAPVSQPSQPTPQPTNSSEEVFIHSNTIIGKVKVIIDGLNIRKGNGNKFAVNCVAQKGEVFNVYANVDDWHCVGGANWVFGNNGQYLSLIRDEPTPVQAQPKKRYVVLPASDPTWRVYPLNVTVKAGNECGKLAPSRFGGLSYPILVDRGVYGEHYVFEIQTESFGRVKLYAHPSTGATIIEK